MRYDGSAQGEWRRPTREVNLAETDLEKFVEAPGRAEKIKQVREMIDKMGIEYLYLQFWLYYQVVISRFV